MDRCYRGRSVGKSSTGALRKCGFKSAEMVNDLLRAEFRDRRFGIAKSDQNHGNIGSTRGFRIRVAVAHQHGVPVAAAQGIHRVGQVPGVRLSVGPGVGAENHREQVFKAEFPDQLAREVLRLVGADPDPLAAVGERPHRRFHAFEGPARDGDVGLVIVEEVLHEVRGPRGIRRDAVPGHRVLDQDAGATAYHVADLFERDRWEPFAD